MNFPSNSEEAEEVSSIKTAVVRTGQGYCECKHNAPRQVGPLYSGGAMRAWPGPITRHEDYEYVMWTD